MHKGGMLGDGNTTSEFDLFQGLGSARIGTTVGHDPACIAD